MKKGFVLHLVSARPNIIAPFEPQFLTETKDSERKSRVPGSDFAYALFKGSVDNNIGIESAQLFELHKKSPVLTDAKGKILPETDLTEGMVVFIKPTVKIGRGADGRLYTAAA